MKCCDKHRNLLFSSTNGLDYTNEEIKSFGSLWGTDARGQAINPDVVKGKDTVDRSTQILFKPYPFDKLGLPILKDANKFESGKFGELFWHQDTDHVYIFYPVDDDLRRGEVKVKFDYQHVTITIQDEIRLSFLCFDRITDGSIWSFEYDKNNKKYIFMDLEKRLRYIQWKGLFGGLPHEQLQDTPEERMKILQKLFQANQGLSKLGGEGTRPATMDEMMEDDDLMSRIYSKVDTKPYPMTDDEVDKDQLNKKLYKKLLYEKKKELGLIPDGEEGDAMEDNYDDEDNDEYEPFPIESEKSEQDRVEYMSVEEDEIKERTDDDLGDYDPEEIIDVKSE